MGLSGKLLQIIALPGVVIIIFAIVAAAAAAATTASIPTKPTPGCPRHCGDVEIPFPFGFTEGCYLDESFRITCENSSTSNSPMIGNIRVRNISTDTHEILVMNWVGRECYQSNNSYYTNLTLPQYTISNSKNRFTVIGCDTIAFLSGFQNGEEFKIGCSSQCPTPTNVGNGSCSGVGCCELRFPYGVKNISIQVQSFNNHENVRNFNPCGYAFVVEKGQFNFSATYLQNYTNQTVPLVLDWAVGNLTCDKAQKEPNFACKNINTTTECINILGGYRCKCKQGYRGNPYLQGLGGCQDIDECLEGTHNCTNQHCFNIPGNYTCGDCKDGEGCPVDDVPPPIIGVVPPPIIGVVIGIGIGLTSTLGGSWWLYLEFQARISIKLKVNFFRQNGGSDLEKHLQRSTAKKAKIFTSEELKEAINNYDMRRIIGKGGYKGFLPDNTIVIKKSKTVDPDQANQFIKGIIQLSKIDHKNVVKLLGCCLETEVPVLVYEFVSERTLFEYIHGEDNTSTKRWETYLRIAVETADALSYLHSLDIIHGDVKPSNILLGDNFTAKISNFGISKLVPHDQNDVDTVVQGIHGYLDPEYLLTNQLTKKSDVYSFGVVLAALLTDVAPSTRSKKRRMVLAELLTDVAPSTRSPSTRPKKRRNVVMHFLFNNFLSLLKEILLSELLGYDIGEEGNKGVDEEGNKGVDEEGKGVDEEGNKDIDEEGNKGVDEEGKGVDEEGNKDIDEEGNKEQIKEVVKLVKMCLRLEGDERPTIYGEIEK
ncbi:wall-associated receptor kinase 2-like [Corylus avellana]|uniref:wall-associated receptor kinase 2-like n=1 Tax=Corylus avellana TaxID=13451 RepID=UPI00286BF0EC|nr:wall-associated receptor kinase 2-like [Corylus avellana]